VLDYYYLGQPTFLITNHAIPLTVSTGINHLPVESIQVIASYLGVKQYQDFRTLCRRYRGLDRVPYLNFARYMQWSEEEGYIGGIALYVPFKLQMSNLNDEQFMFLAVNRHEQEFIRTTTSRQWNRISQDALEKALDFFLTD
jgi:hypothetical protein